MYFQSLRKREYGLGVKLHGVRSVFVIRVNALGANPVAIKKQSQIVVRGESSSRVDRSVQARRINNNFLLRRINVNIQLMYMLHNQT